MRSSRRADGLGQSQVGGGAGHAAGKQTLTGALQARVGPGAAGSAAERGVGKRTLTGALQPRMVAGSGPVEAPPAVGGGAPIADGPRRELERQFEADLAAVRIHEDPWVERQGAAAITRGDDILFAPGRYEPESPAGRELLGHELTHVLQQRGGRVAAPQASRPGLHIDDALEREADAAGARVGAGEPAGVSAGAGAAAAGAGAAAAGAAALQPKMVHAGGGHWRHVPDDGSPGPDATYRKTGDNRYQARDGSLLRYDAVTDRLLMESNAMAASSSHSDPDPDLDPDLGASTSESAPRRDAKRVARPGADGDHDEGGDHGEGSEHGEGGEHAGGDAIAGMDLEQLEAAMRGGQLDAAGWEAAARRILELPATSERRRLQVEFIQELSGAQGLRSPRAKRQRVARPRAVSLFGDLENPSDSEASDLEEEFLDERSTRVAHNQRLTLAPLRNRGHLPLLAEVPEGEEPEYEHLTGLGFASTFGGVFHNGSFVPRALDDYRNVRGHRQRPPEAILRALADRRRTARSDGRGDDDEARHQLQAAFGSLLFPSGASLLDEELDPAAVARQDQTVQTLRDDEAAPPALRALMQRGAPAGQRSAQRSVTETDSEQLIVASKLWQSLTQRLLDAVQRNDGRGEAITKAHTLQIAINRSSCRGCARALCAELVDFWKRIGEMLVPPLGWEAARNALRDRFRFLISFTSTYEYPQERRNDFRNFDQITAALQEAGWTLRVETGFGRGSDESSRAARERLGSGAAASSSGDAASSSGAAASSSDAASSGDTAPPGNTAPSGDTAPPV